jgi:hypothetical protein
MDALDDLQLVPIVQQRDKVWESDLSNVISMSREALAHEARGLSADEMPSAAAKMPSIVGSVARKTTKVAATETRKNSDNA